MKIERPKEWWIRLAQSEYDLPVGAGMLHSSNGCCNPSCIVCEGSPCYSSLCEKCTPNQSILQTGFDKYLEEMLKNPVFKEEYEKTKREIETYDRQHRKKEALEKARKSHGQVGRTSKGSQDKKRMGRSKKGKK